jgi:hypothetical protein
MEKLIMKGLNTTREDAFKDFYEETEKKFFLVNAMKREAMILDSSKKFCLCYLEGKHGINQLCPIHGSKRVKLRRYTNGLI